MKGDRCSETLGHAICEKPDGHTGLHQAKGTVWGRGERIPEWRTRANELRRLHGLVAVKELGR